MKIKMLKIKAMQFISAIKIHFFPPIVEGRQVDSLSLSLSLSIYIYIYYTGTPLQRCVRDPRHGTAM